MSQITKRKEVHVHLELGEKVSDEFLKEHNILSMTEFVKELENHKIVSFVKRNEFGISITTVVLEIK